LPRPDKSGLAMTKKEKTGLMNQAPTLWKTRKEKDGFPLPREWHMGEREWHMGKREWQKGIDGL